MEYNIAQLRRIAVVYDTIAKLLPTEGKDYKVVFNFLDENDPSKLNIQFIPFTEIGKLWCGYCSKAFKEIGKTI